MPKSIINDTTVIWVLKWPKKSLTRRNSQWAHCRNEGHITMGSSYEPILFSAFIINLDDGVKKYVYYNAEGMNLERMTGIWESSAERDLEAEWATSWTLTRSPMPPWQRQTQQRMYEAWRLQGQWFAPLYFMFSVHLWQCSLRKIWINCKLSKEQQKLRDLENITYKNWKKSSVYSKEMKDKEPTTRAFK